jgi:hypothetical protein
MKTAFTPQLQNIISKSVVTNEYPEGITKEYKGYMNSREFYYIKTYNTWDSNESFGRSSGNSHQKRLGLKTESGCIWINFDSEKNTVHYYEEIIN